VRQLWVPETTTIVLGAVVPAAHAIGANDRDDDPPMALEPTSSYGDIEGKLEVLRVECTRCPRKGRYSVAKLIEKYSRKGNMMKWKEQLNGDCSKRDWRLHDRCDLICPDLPNPTTSKPTLSGKLYRQIYRPEKLAKAR
jgi:hypothetical protein